MRSIEMSELFPLSSVKPLDDLLSYRAYCLSETRKALTGTTRRRDRSPVTGAALESIGEIEGFAYGRDPENGSFFLAVLPESRAWADLLARVNQYRHSPRAFHLGLAQSRVDHVYAPKVAWIQDTLRLQGIDRPRILEAVTPPSDLTPLLRDSHAFSAVCTMGEMAYAQASAPGEEGDVSAAILLESLDRVDDPAALLRTVAKRLAHGGLLFLTALAASGFDMAVLGLQNLYLYPPDRANCFTLQGLSGLLTAAGFSLVEVSTPGVLDVEIVRAHVQRDPTLPLPPFERRLIEADGETHEAFQAFLQQQRLSSFARIVARKR